jgi:hypothetical protein
MSHVRTLTLTLTFIGIQGPTNHATRVPIHVVQECALVIYLDCGSRCVLQPFQGSRGQGLEQFSPSVSLLLIYPTVHQPQPHDKDRIEADLEVPEYDVISLTL